MDTQYKDIDDPTGYRVGSDGSVWSRHKTRWGLSDDWHKLKPGIIRSKGYRNYSREMVHLGRGKGRYVHHLVLEAFIGPRPPGHEACHTNGNPMDNRLSNLYWGLPSDNDQDMRRHGRKKGELHHAAILTDQLVREIRKHAAEGKTHQSIADALGIQRRNVSRVVDRTRWAHVL